MQPHSETSCKDNCGLIHVAPPVSSEVLEPSNRDWTKTSIHIWSLSTLDLLTPRAISPNPSLRTYQRDRVGFILLGHGYPRRPTPDHPLGRINNYADCELGSMQMPRQPYL